MKLKLFLMLFLVSCAGGKVIDLTRINIGMTQQQVISALGRKPDNVIGSKEYPAGIVKVLQFTRWKYGYSDIPEERYWLYFLNDTLKQWGRPGDWERAADHVYELRIK